MKTRGPDTPKRRRGLGRMLLVALLAFGFSFALVPLYRIACEKVLGIRLEQGPANATAATRRGVDETRWVTVQFDGGVNSALPWEFHPRQLSMKVRPGRQYETTYYARNTSRRVIVGSAVPSVAPARGSRYFNKTECFCFTAQTLRPGESRDMPVRFIVDPGLPKDVNTLTLSYAFFRNDPLTAEAARVAAAR
ncbi:cytochrome c oxidase assembly protein [Lysobacter pythonis]|uniref:Cytochrome c oxidase assembly protein CtaG n=1 Tax=Solilutibacter pythonis TaxID=2483112 RepID=A0A3M2HNV8_9GAMM|nr:cytochrome c oxidase assembly protein [Lysobacter pythonis]RMH89019.1 cytochrome c oxidase assembly protein [Lysobacter pythonis]